MPREDDGGNVGRCRVALFSGSVVVTLRPPLTPLPGPRECLFCGAGNGMGMVFPQPYLQQESVFWFTTLAESWMFFRGFTCSSA